MSKIASGSIKELFTKCDEYETTIQDLEDRRSKLLGLIKKSSNNQTKFNLPDGRVVVICEKRGGDRGWFLRVLNQRGKGVEVK